MMTYMWALYAREVKRFQKIWMDTVFSPIVSVGLYLAVFGIIAGSRMIDGLPYLTFIYTGLLTMTLVNSSFSNPAFALIIAKNVGNIIDLQLAPIQAGKIGIAYALAALTRAVITIIIALAATMWFIPHLTVAHPGMLLLGILLSGIEFGFFGVVVGMRAKNFEALTFMTTFIMQPMIFLAGVFYPISNLPHPWDVVSKFNPIHHTVNFMRWSVTNYSDSSPLLSLGVMAGLTVVLFALSQYYTNKSLTQQ